MDLLCLIRLVLTLVLVLCAKDLHKLMLKSKLRIQQQLQDYHTKHLMMHGLMIAIQIENWMIRSMVREPMDLQELRLDHTQVSV